MNGSHFWCSYSPHDKKVLLAGLGCGFVPKIPINAAITLKKNFFVGIYATVHANTLGKYLYLCCHSQVLQKKMLLACLECGFVPEIL